MEFGEKDSLHPADVYAIFDGGKTGNKVTIQKSAFGAVGAVITRYIQIHLDEESVADNLVHGHGFMNLLVGCYLCTAPAAIMRPTGRAREHYGGTDKSNWIGPVKVPCWTASATWSLPLASKHLLYGDNRIAVGGTGDVADDAD